MRLRYYFLFLFYSLLFLFYPGASQQFNIFSNNRVMFQSAVVEEFVVRPTPPAIPVAVSQQLPPITAEAAYVLDLPSYTPVFALNQHQKLLPASTTKIITALVAIDMYSPNQVITIPQIQSIGQQMGLVEGERITVENLLYGLLVYSGNDAAEALAQARGYDQFISHMNQKAKSLGMTNSNFENPSGLDDARNYSTAFDLALASRELLKNPILRKIVATKQITVSDVDFQHFHELININRLLGEIPGLRGLKTGQTELAGENLISFYKPDGHEYLIVVLKSEDRFSDTRTIIDWIHQNVKYDTL